MRLRIAASVLALSVLLCSHTAAQAPKYKLVAWSELGMHCMDGKDYSVFAVLPPYNVVHAQLVKMGEPP